MTAKSGRKLFCFSLFQSKMFQPLPRKLTFPCQLSVSDVYGTTTGDTFEYKRGDIYPQSLYKKAPLSMKVNYILDTAERVYFFTMIIATIYALMLCYSLIKSHGDQL